MVSFPHSPYSFSLHAPLPLIPECTLDPALLTDKLSQVGLIQPVPTYPAGYPTPNAYNPKLYGNGVTESKGFRAPSSAGPPPTTGMHFLSPPRIGNPASNNGRNPNPNPVPPPAHTQDPSRGQSYQHFQSSGGQGANGQQKGWCFLVVKE